MFISLFSFFRFRVPGPIQFQTMSSRVDGVISSEQSASLSGKESREVDVGGASSEPILCVLEDERYLLNYDD